MNRNIITIDGPSGVGKGTLTDALCEHYGFAGLDTGSLYRAITLHLIKTEFDVLSVSEKTVLDEAEKLFETHEVLKLAADPEIRAAPTTQAVFKIANNAPLRELIRKYQYDFAANPPGGAKGVVIEGCDIGTDIFPLAPVKFFLTARPEIKANRRVAEYISAGRPAVFEEILADMTRRDKADTERKIAALKPAADAIVIDTSDLSKKEVLARATEIIDARLHLK